ncbi:MAG: DNA repair protein RecO, partial [Planctomycetota bacterium]
LFDTLELSWTANPRTELQTLKAGRPLRLRRPISRNLDRYRRALEVIELADLAARPGHAEPELYAVLELALERFSAEMDPELTQLAFNLQFLGALGLAPALESCASCGKKAPVGGSSESEVQFSAGAGGCLCSNCARDARSTGGRVGRLPINVLRIANSLRAADSVTLGAYRLPAERRSSVRDFVERFLEYHLASRPSSRRSADRSRQSKTRTASR